MRIIKVSFEPSLNMKNESTWRVANFLITFQWVTFLKFKCATECATAIDKSQIFGRF